jgi:hypothetical protein
MHPTQFALNSSATRDFCHSTFNVWELLCVYYWRLNPGLASPT